MGQMIRLSGRLICASHDEANIVHKFLPEHVRLTKEEPGCISFDVAQTEDPLVWRVEECFADRPAFEAHQTRTLSSSWGTATKAIRREYEIFEEP
jgi:quinol monooxygenase YgiN